jgi:hypothetical protein
MYHDVILHLNASVWYNFTFILLVFLYKIQTKLFYPLKTEYKLNDM